MTLSRFAIVAAAVLAAPAAAGPPYVTDDPQPTDVYRFEVYLFGAATRVPGETSGAGGIDFNYGAAPDLQLTAVVPVAFDDSDGGHAGPGNVELAAKYEFLHQRDGSALPDVSVFPRVFVPAGGHRFGTGRVGLLLPLWLERDVGKWSVFGGGGLTLNPGVDQRNYWSSGIAVTRAIGARVTIGAELYHRGPDARDARAFTGANLGATLRLSRHWSLIASAGPGLQNASAGQASGYAALKADF